MKNLRALCYLSVALAVIPATAFAQWAYPTRDVNLRAGPAYEYPVVVRIGIGTAMSVAGCLDDYQWCDVIAGPYRGWIYAGNIVYPYQDSNVPVLTYGPALGIGIVAFALGSYWDSHYRYQPWYPQQQYWINRYPHGAVPGHRFAPTAPGFRSGAQFPQRPAPAFRQGAQVAPAQAPSSRQGNRVAPLAPRFGPGTQAPQRPAPVFRQGAQALPVPAPTLRPAIRAASPAATSARTGGNRPAPQHRPAGNHQRSPQQRNAGGR